MPYTYVAQIKLAMFLPTHRLQYKFKYTCAYQKGLNYYMKTQRTVFKVSPKYLQTEKTVRVYNQYLTKIWLNNFYSNNYQLTVEFSIKEFCCTWFKHMDRYWTYHITMSLTKIFRTFKMKKLTSQFKDIFRIYLEYV